MKLPSKVVIHTDGAYSRLRNIGAYAYISQFLKWNSEQEEYQLIKEINFSKQVVGTTSNRMELIAAIEALKALNRPCIVEIVSDATYLVDTINKWLGAFIADPTRANHDLMIELYKEKNRHIEVTATWVRGHSNNVRNDRVNELAQRAAETWKGKY